MGQNPWMYALNGGDLPQLQQQAQQDQPYPSYPNTMGLGSQIPFAPSPTEAPGAPQLGYLGPQQNNQAQPDTGSRGFNPWSLQGEANVR